MKRRRYFFKVFPNPIKVGVTFQFYYQYHRLKSNLCLINSNGIIIANQEVKNGDQSLTLPLKDKPVGTYFVQYQSNGLILQTEEIIKSN